MTSPSARRAWIEISRSASQLSGREVALRTEGVDRNKKSIKDKITIQVALRTEGVDRNITIIIKFSKAISRPPHGGRG